MISRIRSEQMHHYWQHFKKSHKRIFGTLTTSEYADLETRAKRDGRSLWGQMKLESQSYCEQKYLPSKTLEEELAKLTHVLRGIAGNINQTARHSNWLKQLVMNKNIIGQITQMEKEVRQFLENPRFKLEDLRKK